MSEAPVEPRVGDRERHAADEHLRAAVGDGVLTLTEYEERAGQLWAARTRREVDVLLADLPGRQPALPGSAPGSDRPRRVVAVMSEDALHGPLAPGQEAQGWALMGSAVVDLRRADLPDGTRVRVGALMGEVEVQVPPGTRVQLSGFTLMGDRKVRVAPGTGPVVHVAAWAVMGSVNVTVGDGSVVPAQAGPSPAWLPMTARPPAPVERPPVLRRLARRASGLGVAGVLVLGVGAVVASGTDARTVFGSTTERVGDDDGGTVRVSVLFGSVVVVVPDDVRVDTGGLVVFGSVDCEAACDGSGQGRVVDVRPYGGFGSVEVVTESELATDGDD